MKKLKLHIPNILDKNIAHIKTLFPNCVTEAKDENDILKYAIDFEQLKQELSDSIIDGSQERYRLDWPGKREALITANTPISKTLRPAPEESVDFDTTKNLFIEGDNLEVLKLLQETYLGKVKMIYIDPPYNTSKDFVYRDNFTQNKDDFLTETGQRDDMGNRLIANTESNGRFHSDWLSMIYPRLKLARNLLSDDGVIFISIDDNEQANLKKLCDEVFGEDNFVGCLPTIMNLKGNNDEFGFAGTHEYTLVFAKQKSSLVFNDFAIDEEDLAEWQEDEISLYKKGRGLLADGDDKYREDRPDMYFPVLVKDNQISHITNDEYKKIYVQNIFDDNFIATLKKKYENEGYIFILPHNKHSEKFRWTWGFKDNQKFKTHINDIIITSNNQGIISFYKKQRPSLGDLPSKKPKSIFYKPEYSSGNGTTEQKNTFGKIIFKNPKPTYLIKDFIEIGSNPNDLILDFFAGSGTTAHAVMQLNAEDNGNRKFICVQIPEKTDEKSEAFKAGYKNIAEISKKRIRLAGAKIKSENPMFTGDVDFRVLKTDTSNMVDVYYAPDKTKQSDLLTSVDNIKPDRTADDLLFQVLLDWGVDLTLPIVKKTIMDKTVFFVSTEPHDLVACFDKGISEDFIKEIAKTKPLRVVFRDNGFATDAVKINSQQIFKQLSPSTDVKVI